MPHADVYKIFVGMFPQFDNKIDTYFPNGRNSIRVCLNDGGKDLIFTYNEESIDEDWRLESKASFIRKMKGA